MFRRLRLSSFLAIFIGLLLFLRLPSFFEPYWYGDEGVYLTLGLAIRRGLVLYRQIHDNKPPLLYYFAAISQTVFGFRLLLFLFMIPTYYFFLRLAKKFISSPRSRHLSLLFFLLLTSTPIIEGHIANAEVFMLLPTLAAVYLIYTSSSFLIAGVLLGLAFTIKVPVFAEVAFLGLWLLFIQKTGFRSILPLALGFILPISLWSIYYFFQGAFSQFLFASLLQNFGYLSSWTTGSHSGSATEGGLATRGLLFVISLLVTYFLFRRRRLSSSSAFLLSWFSATLFGSLLSSRPYPHYLLQLSPPLALILFSSLRRAKIIVFLTLILAIIKFNFYFYPVFSYYYNFYSHLIGLKSTFAYRQYFGQEIPAIYQLSDYIVSHTSPHDPIFIWGDHPYLYALSNRLPVGRYTVAYHILDFNGHQETISRLQAVLPRLIVYYPMPSRPFPELDSLLSRYYYPVFTAGSSIIYQLR